MLTGVTMLVPKWFENLKMWKFENTENADLPDFYD